MKISKLFHWLYASLMFLPFVFFLPSCLYYGFNEHATNTETTTINYKYQSNEVNTLDDLVPNHIYECDKLMFADDLNINYQAFNMQVHYIGGIGVSAMDSTYVELTSIQELNSTLAVYDDDYGEGFYYLNMYLDYEVENSSIGQWYYYLQTYHIIFSFEDDIQITEFKKFYNATLDVYTSNEITMPHFTDYNVIESVEVNTSDTISDKLSYSWQRVWDLPLFSWTHNSFVSAPFTYISGLFGIQANSTLNYVFTYFVSISICWLVFDVLLYVPNLAHRWLDKGAIE